MLTLLIETAAPRMALKNLRWSNHHSHLILVASRSTSVP